MTRPRTKKRHPRWVAALTMASALAVGVGCSGSDTMIASGEGSLCADIVERQRGCGFITEGHVSCIDTRFFGIRSPPDVSSLREGTGNSDFNRNLSCVYECLMALTCDEWREIVMSAALCPSTVRVAHLESSCRRECYERTFPCPVGAELPVTLAPQVCDGGTSCPDERDEVGCNYKLCGGGGTPNRFDGCAAPAEQKQDRSECGEDAFECPEGRLIDARFVCDGQTRNCCDGEDEMGCPNNFYCNDGSFVPAERICNGLPDCPSAIDEEGCAEYVRICD